MKPHPYMKSLASEARRHGVELDMEPVADALTREGVTGARLVGSRALADALYRKCDRLGLVKRTPDAEGAGVADQVIALLRARRGEEAGAAAGKDDVADRVVELLRSRRGQAPRRAELVQPRV